MTVLQELQSELIKIDQNMFRCHSSIYILVRHIWISKVASNTTKSTENH